MTLPKDERTICVKNLYGVNCGNKQSGNFKTNDSMNCQNTKPVYIIKRVGRIRMDTDLV